jgi:hypothetical protein
LIFFCWANRMWIVSVSPCRESFSFRAIGWKKFVIQYNQKMRFSLFRIITLNFLIENLHSLMTSFFIFNLSNKKKKKKAFKFILSFNFIQCDFREQILETTKLAFVLHSHQLHSYKIFPHLGRIRLKDDSDSSKLPIQVQLFTWR